MTKFDYWQAFARNLGFLTAPEQNILRGKRIAIAGMGGVGGSHLITLARLGIGKFRIADFDKFEIGNLNRQYGANMNTLGKSKSQTMKQMALDINPEAEIEIFDRVHRGNVEDFIRNSHVVIDALDFFAFEDRRALYHFARKLEVPVISCGPIGMGASLIIFTPESITFDQYFDWQMFDSFETKAVKFLIGITPKLKAKDYMGAPGRLDFRKGHTSSLAIGPQFAAGVMASEALKIMLKRGKVRVAPHAFHYDAYFQKVFHSYVWLGNRNPIQRFKIWLFKKFLHRDNKSRRWYERGLS